ncbi:sugar phosphate nucleotidyltransferase [Blastopirellula marina]|uniref:Glycosyl transferase family 2 n=1 Tax=Blastopirellula marina TaxID=124 RepID=A0A2S8FSN4_9BACT|nr:sugar phosphate nucleotidyltransferase [Blastopirellula marina]PQO35189.1 glycosyl transferase family 2 [Blastopirellula marina]PTL43938.1 glycosyl transferase family 2 [Blastopirellula marina]
MKRLAVVLAAGKGTRMKSELPKVLVPALGRPMIEYVLEALTKVGVDQILVVVGHRADLVRETLADRPGVRFIDQTEQLGTGHAVMVCREELNDFDGSVVVLTGDSPLVQVGSLEKLLDRFEQEEMACLLGTLEKENPTGLGRIVRDDEGRFTGIVEEKDATEQQRQIREVNMSTYVFDCQNLLSALDKLTNENRQREYYLTDCPAILRQMGLSVDASPVLEACEALSVNSMEDLRLVEEEMSRLGYTK